MKSLSEDLQRWRDKRPDGVQMDSFIRRALILEKETTNKECYFEQLGCLLQKYDGCNISCLSWRPKE